MNLAMLRVSVKRTLAASRAASASRYSVVLTSTATSHAKENTLAPVTAQRCREMKRPAQSRQSLPRAGWQQERYPVLDPDGSPVSLLREADGSPARIAFGLPGGRSLSARIWVAQVGRVPLLLLALFLGLEVEGFRRRKNNTYCYPHPHSQGRFRLFFGGEAYVSVIDKPADERPCNAQARGQKNIKTDP